MLTQSNNEKKISASTIFSIDTIDNIDLGNYDKDLRGILDKYFNENSEEFKKLSEEEKELFSKYKLITVLNTQEDNEKQVKEVTAGLIGEKWHTGNSLGYLGWIFGGIQLVFLVMLALVSWRAALIAAMALPLSFFFSTIYVQFTGNDLNTLVLFSLVLVIGLVVDPALVVLESIQRNLDNGLDRKTAVLNAINEIGGGLLLAVVTSMLVFVPFGVVSGIFGEIISYIPLTIIPAIIGSYIVPLVFLSWIGSKFLKRRKKSSDEEHENLWPVAKWMVRVNENILKPGFKHVLLRIFIIIFSVLIPFGVAGFYFSSGKVKSVQFAEPSDADFLTITTQNYPQKTYETFENDNKTLVSELIKNPNIEFITPFSGFGGNSTTNVTYLVNLKDKSERHGIKANQIASDLNNVLKEKFESTFFYAEAGVLGNGPTAGSFPMSIAIKTDDLAVQEKVAHDITNILNTVCKTGDLKFELKTDCDPANKIIVKIDNGYDGKEVKFIDISLQRDKLNANPVNPIELRELLASLFEVNEGNKVATLTKDTKDYEVVLSKIAADPNKLEQIKNIDVRTLLGTTVKLSDIADIKEVQTLESIGRLKGETVGVVNAKPIEEFDNQGLIAQIQNKVIEEFNKNYNSNYKDVVVETYSEGDTAGIAKSFAELGIAFLLAIILTYFVLVIFFNSFTQPLVILFSIPLTFIGIFPALAAFAGGQLGFLEIIGIIILVGLVENVAIFLIDTANQKIKEGWDERKAIAYASGVRFRPIILTKLTTLVSTAPLAILSEQYRSISVVIIFGLLTSGIISLFTSPILFIFFKWLSRTVRNYPIWGKVLFFLSLPILPFSLIAIYIIDSTKK